MGFFDDVGLSDLGGVDVSGIGTTVLIVVLMFIIALAIGGFVFWHYYKKFKKASFKNNIPIFLEVAGKIQRIGIDSAKELFVPDSNISLFFLKSRKIYLARPTRAMGKNEYWYKILENNEWVNFEMSNHPEDNTLAIANYDHRDTRYAYVNLKDIIKKNYKDKAVQWWKEYSGVITIVVVGLMFVGAMWFFFWRTGKMLEMMAPISDNMRIASENMIDAVKNSQNINSGVIQAS